MTLEDYLDTHIYCDSWNNYVLYNVKGKERLAFSYGITLHYLTCLKMECFLIHGKNKPMFLTEVHNAYKCYVMKLKEEIHALKMFKKKPSDYK